VANRSPTQLSFLAFSLLLLACGGGTGDGVTAPPPTPVASVEVTLTVSSLSVGRTSQASAVAKDAAGNVLSGRTIQFSSSDITVATVSATGTVTAVSPGTVAVIATSEGKQGSATLIVTRAASVEVSLSSPTLTVGATSQATAIVKDANGNVLSNESVGWNSADKNVATINATTGVVSAVAPGSVLITATTEGISGNATLTVVASPPASPEQRSIAAGYLNTCALSPSGSAWCWGDNVRGSIGNGQTGSSVGINTPTQVVGGLTFKAIYSGNNSPSNGAIVCALTNDGYAYCWGPVFQGTAGFASPTPISSSLAFRKLSVGGTHACGITGDSRLYCWGTNAYGELMTGASDFQSTVPRLGLQGRTVADVAAGYLYTCAVLTTGETVCAGINNWNQSGTTSGSVCNGFACNPSATTIALPSPLVRLTAGREFTCGLDANGQAYCWGHNDALELGVGTQQVPGGNQNDARPAGQTVVGGHSFSDLRAGDSEACGLSGATMYCWGIVGGAPTGTPTAVATPSNLATLSLGADQVCGADTGGSLWCWGGNQRGQLGDGAYVGRQSPAVVPGFVVRVP
jgi:alpha-tubulin suppressor-like RCC1 family protein